MQNRLESRAAGAPGVIPVLPGGSRRRRISFLSLALLIPGLPSPGQTPDDAAIRAILQDRVDSRRAAGIAK